MAGTKGKSGGARSGAGRKQKEAAVTGYSDPIDFLRAVWTGEVDATVAQVRAASSALPFIHKRLGEGGKKEGAEEKQKAAASGRFGRRQPPKLVAAGGKKV
jgi:hypothetical protein